MSREKMKKTLRASIILIGSVVVIGYARFAFRDIIRGPVITITEPVNGESYATSSLRLSGTATRIQDITLNNRQILIDEAGNFDEIIILFPGYNTFTIAGRDKFGRTTSTKLQLIRK